MSAINANANPNTKRANEQQVRRRSRKIKRSKASNTVRAMLRGAYWAVFMAIIGLVLYVIFEIYKTYDEGHRKQLEQNVQLYHLPALFEVTNAPRLTRVEVKYT